MKTALITGASGFLGRHFSESLRATGDWDVSGIDIMPGKNVISYDARKYFASSHSRAHHFDLVLHCAAVVGGREVTSNSPLSQAVNLELDAALFQWALRAKPGRIVYFSSSAVYPVCLQNLASKYQLREVTVPPLSGPDRFRQGVFPPDSLYGWSKLTGEYLAELARAQGLKVSVVRPFSGYGEDQDDCYPFPAFIRRARASADPFRVWGNPMQVRDFIHVDDIVRAVMAMTEREIDGPANICTGSPVGMGSLARMICMAAGYSPGAVLGDEKAPMGVEYRVGDPRQMLGFYTPRVSLEEGIQRALKYA